MRRRRPPKSRPTVDQLARQRAAALAAQAESGTADRAALLAQLKPIYLRKGWYRHG
ncbi:hypothetical protein EDC02_5921 [Micromonospora sp. Llam0]|uniref:hypothetical protein n=1 Tax=Micromonospora sp. Llam0 TaxID=2485143 RepID=UPI000FBB893A|nr:hypothetical protein [Micromonospora sp. Llam0]ROO51057.1 hypothetical protein EDC02_5921 [Micromonospora sp. Llam0]